MNITQQGLSKVLLQLKAIDNSVRSIGNRLKTTNDGGVFHVNISGSITISDALYEECNKGPASRELLMQALKTYDGGKYGAYKLP